MHIIVLLLYCCMFVLPLAAAAQDPFEQLIKAKSLKCHFGAGSVGTWKNGTLVVKQDTFDADFHFDNIDFKAQQVRVIGNKGADNGTAVLTPTGATFIERTSGGNFAFTTVFPDYKIRYARVCCRNLTAYVCDGHSRSFPIPRHLSGVGVSM